MRSSLLFPFFVLFLLWPIPLFAQIVISEIMWAGSDLSSSDEWLELANGSDAPVDISHWYLTYIKSTGAETTMATFASGTVILPGGFFLVGSKHEVDSRLAREPDLFASSLVLPNTKLQVTLKDPAGVVMDQADDGTGSPFAGVNPSGTGAKASMERIDLRASGTMEDNWRTATDSQGFDEGLPLFGTPGFANSIDSACDPSDPCSCDPADPLCLSSSSSSYSSAPCIDPLAIGIFVQSGELKGIGKTTVNFQAVALSGSLAGRVCRWWFTDGYTSMSCNPPVRSFTTPGITIVNLEVENQCGNTLIQTLNVEVISEVSSSSSAGAASSTSVYYDGARVIIAGVLPNPAGADTGKEWVELRNVEDRPVSLSGYELAIGDGTKKHLQLSGTMGPRDVLRLWNSEVTFTLKNTGDVMRLVAPNGEILSTVSWEGAKDDRIYLPVEIRECSVTATVARIIDGDTVDLSVDADTARVLGNEVVRVRLIGVDTPELYPKSGGAEPFASEASEFLRALTEGKKVELEFDTDLWDPFGRLLAYVYIDGGISVQEQLLVNGMARATPAFEFVRKERFLDLESRAQESKMGMWSGKSVPALKDEEKEDNAPVGSSASSSAVSQIVEYDDAWNGVYVSEVFASPDAKSAQPFLAAEWVEFGREWTEPLALSGWTLTVGGRSKILDHRTGFGSGAFLIIPMKDWKLQLPNAGGTIVLHAPDGSVVADLTYPKLKSTQSYAWHGPSDAFCVSGFPTPLAENRCGTPAPAPKKTAAVSTKTLAYAASYREQLKRPENQTIDLTGYGSSGEDVSASWLLFMTLPGAAVGVLVTVLGTRMGWIRVEK